MKELKELGLTWFEAQAKARDRLEWRNLVAALCPNRGEKVEWVSERVGRDSGFKICKTIGIMGLKGRSGRDDGIEEPYRETQKPET